MDSFMQLVLWKLYKLVAALKFPLRHLYINDRETLRGPGNSRKVALVVVKHVPAWCVG